MYYDPYEECPERQATENIVKAASDQDDLKSVGQNLDVEQKIADSIQHLVNPQMEIQYGEGGDIVTYNSKQMNQTFHAEDLKRTHNTQVEVEDALHTAPRHTGLNSSSMVMTQNSAYMPPADYGNLAQLKKQKEDEIEDEDEFHDAYMDLEPELMSLKQESSLFRKGPLPVPMPRNLKTGNTQQPNDASLYEEPWDLIHKRLNLEKCFEAAAHADQNQSAPMNDSVDLCAKGYSEFRADSSLTDKFDTNTLTPTNELQYLQNSKSGFLLSETSRSGKNLQQAINGSSAFHSKFSAGIRANHGSNQPESVPEQQRDNRGQEGYENPWDLKPHLKDKRPAAEYEIPWDKNARGLELLDSLLVSDNSAINSSAHLSRNEGSAKIERDFRPAAEYDQPWDKMKFNSKTAVVLPFQVCDSDSAVQMIDKIDPKIPLELQGWYHGAISRVEAEGLLRVYPEGSFLVRTSESNRLDFSLSVKSTSGFMHMKIVNQDSRYILGQFSQPFYTIPQMIHHYTVHKLPIKGAEHMSLMFPIGNVFL